MDVANPLWQRYLLGQEAQRKALGCHGLFLDTIWQEGQEIAVTNTIANFRKNWGNGYFIANNAHLIKTLIRDSVDGFLFEDFFTKGSTADHRLWYTKQMQEYQSIQKQYGKSLYAISYGNPFISPKWGNEVLKNALDYRFEVIFADANLTNIYGHVDFSAKKIVK